MGAVRHVRRLHAAIAVIERRGRYLICQRREDDSLGSYWEFPGGKREPGESWEACVRREVHEELGVSIRSLQPFGTSRYRYPDGTISFRVFRCSINGGTPRPLDAQSLRWVTPHQLRHYWFPAANQALLQRLIA